MATIKELRKRLEKAKKEVQKSDELLTQYRKEFKEEARELTTDVDNAAGTMPFVSDKKLLGIQKRIKKEEERNERLALATVPLEEMLSAAKSKAKNDAIAFVREHREKAITEHTKAYAIYKEKLEKLQEIKKQVGDLYHRKVDSIKFCQKAEQYLTDERTGDLFEHVQSTIDRNPELRQLLTNYQELAEILNPEIIQEIQEREKRVKKEVEKAKENKQSKIQERRDLLLEAEKWIRSGYFPYELFSSAHMLSADTLSAYWRQSNINPKTDYDSNRCLIKRREVA